MPCLLLCLLASQRCKGPLCHHYPHQNAHGHLIQNLEQVEEEEVERQELQ